MKRSSFKPKAADPAAQLKAAHREAKKGFKGRKRIQSRRKQYKGIQFASTWEYLCYLELETRLNAGEIKNLDTHVVLPINIKNESGAILRLTIEIDFTYFDNRLKREVRADAKPPKRMDKAKVDWFRRWKILQHLEPDFMYIIWRQHSTFRDIDI